MAKFFGDIIKKLEGFRKLTIDDIALEIAKMREHSALVISLNTNNQLFLKGEDALERSLADIGGGYSPLTVSIKQSKGQPTNRVTLKDTGDFYATFIVTPFKGGFRIEANPIKDDTNLFEEWGENIVGLNEKNLQIVIDFYAEELNKRVNKILGL